MSMTLGDLKALALDYADVTDDPFINSDLFAKQANIEMGKLFDLIIASDENWRVSTVSIQVVPGTRAYMLPADFYKALKVFYVDISGYRRPMRRVSIAELGTLTDGQGITTQGSSLTLPYVPRFLPLKNDDDEVFPEIPDSWADHAILGLAMRIRIKEESDIAALQAMQADIRQTIVTMCKSRDLGEPMVVEDYYKSHGGGYRTFRGGRFGGFSQNEIYDLGPRYAIVGRKIVVG